MLKTNLPENPTLADMLKALSEVNTEMMFFLNEFCPTEDDHKVHRRLVRVQSLVQVAVDELKAVVPQ